MIIKPLSYSRYYVNNNTKTIEFLGGYLLNNEYFGENIIIDNWRSKLSSEILNNNVIYQVVNNLSSVPYKINTEVLDFISAYDDLYHLTYYKR